MKSKLVIDSMQLKKLLLIFFVFLLFYPLSVSKAEISARNDIEPNDDPANATLLVLNVTFYGNISKYDYLDFFKFTLTGGEDEVSAELSHDSDAVLGLFFIDKNKMQLDRNYTYKGNCKVRGIAYHTGEHYVAVGWRSGSGLIQYKMTINVSKIAVILDGNNAYNESCIAYNGFENKTSISKTDDVHDFYKFFLNSSFAIKDVLSVILISPITCDIEIEIYDSNLNYIANSNAFGLGANENFSYFPQKTDFYYLRVRAVDGYGTYTIKFFIDIGYLDDNNNQSNAIEVFDDSAIVSNVSKNFDNCDYYKIFLIPNETINITLETKNYEKTYKYPNLNLWFYDHVQHVLFSTELDPIENIFFNASAYAYHYIRVSTEFGSGEYELRVRVDSPPLPYGPIEMEMPEDTIKIINLNDFFYDKDGDELNFSYKENKNINISIENGNATLKPKENFFGEEYVKFIAFDKKNKSCESRIKIIVTPINDQPVIIWSGEIKIYEDENITISLLDIFYDPDDDKLEYEVSSNVIKFSIENESLMLYPPENWFGFEILKIKAKDSNYNTTLSLNFTVLPVDDPPIIIEELKNIAMYEDIPYKIYLMNYFREVDGEELSFSVIGNKTLICKLEGSNLTLIPPLNWPYEQGMIGEDEIIISASDGRTNVYINLKISVLPVNDAPYIYPIPDLTAYEDVNYSIYLSQYIWDDSDIKGLNISFVSNFAILSGLTLILRYPEGILNDTVMFVVSDGEYYTYQRINVTVIPVNDQPFLYDIKAKDSIFYVSCKDMDSDKIDVYIIIDGEKHRMKIISGNNIDGIKYEYRAQLSSGKHSYFFVADDGYLTTKTQPNIMEIKKEMYNYTYIYVIMGIIVAALVTVALILSARAEVIEVEKEERKKKKKKIKKR
ncbi:MAG: tandem-95 repeat protein [Candidatus Thermoplasmatota archaeon]